MEAQLRPEPDARLRCDERGRPDPRHRGIEIVERVYSLVMDDEAELRLPPGSGEAVLAVQARRAVLVGEVEGRHWWMYEGLIYSTSQALSRGTVERLADGGGEGPDRSRGRAAYAISPPAGVVSFLADVSPLIAV